MTDPRATAGEPDDDALIARWRNGDERAASLLVERHATPLARFIVSLGERRDVEEVVQDAFVRAFDSLDRFRADSTFRTWLFAIARNLVRDRVRSRKAERLVIPIEEWHAATAKTALDVAVADETETRMRAAVERLSPLQRDVFTLRVAEGLSYREIATVVGSTEGAARVHYHNAMRAIKEFLDE